MGRLRWVKAVVLIVVGMTSKIMRTLLQPASGTGHHDHMAASISGI